ncbi:hypothetical protein UPYG_G00216040 [Umbra pygmaea]|uniref:Adhesion G-protein coupled receptor G4 n=1 Tax=Umbra pygmaea TaxID=75934 RepID=A0ABD0WQZ1_UMBPY
MTQWVMKSVKTPCFIVCLWLLANSFSPCSGLLNPSLWGKKVEFMIRPCVLQLDKDHVVPPLKEVSVCLHLRREIATPEWTGFVYKAPGEKSVELGLAGQNNQLVARLFGQQWPVAKDLPLGHWQVVCLTWSSYSERLRLYINGSRCLDAHVNASLPRQLVHNGTLTLGASHNKVDGVLDLEDGKELLGFVSLFRMWSQELTAEELWDNRCVDGNVVSWDARNWDYKTCRLEYDSSLQCAWSRYNINMKTSIEQQHLSKPVQSTENVIRDWLGAVFPGSFSIEEIFVSPPSQVCHVADTASEQDTKEVQESRILEPNSTSVNCISVNVLVLPKTDVGVTQAEIFGNLSVAFTSGQVNLQADPGSLCVRPIGLFTKGTVTPPTFTNTSAGSQTSPDPTDLVTLTETQPTLGAGIHPTGGSTTKEPFEHNSTGKGMSPTFYSVNMTLKMNVTGNDPGTTIQNWVQTTLWEVQLSVLHFKMLTSIYRANSASLKLEKMAELTHEKIFTCTFNVEDVDSRNVTATQKLIVDHLSGNHADKGILVYDKDIHVTQIDPGSCPEDTYVSFWGQYIWPMTEAGNTQEMMCEKNHEERASRTCMLDGLTQEAKWAKPNLKACKPIITISDLDAVSVTANNTADVVDIIEELVGGEKVLNDSELNSVIQKLDEVLEVGSVTPELGGDIVNIIGDILGSDTDVSEVTNSILNITESVGQQMDFPEEALNVTVPSLSLSMVNVDKNDFQGLTFGVSSFSAGKAPETFVNHTFVSQPSDSTVASISLPHDLQNFFPQGNNKERIQFHFYGTKDLFQEPESNWKLDSYVVSASVNRTTVSNLENPVVVTLSHIKPRDMNEKVKCVYWDFQKNKRKGGWDSNGCETIPRNSFDQTTCHCYHLTHFGILLDLDRNPISEADQGILTVISYLGCGVSSIFLSISLLTYLAFEKLRKDHPSKILINLSIALLGLNLVFLLDSWLSSLKSYALCITTAAVLHYFLLASFSWMALEAVHMYFALVKVFNVYIPSYILKFCVLGWGIPLVVVSLVLAIEMDAYGSAVTLDSVDTQQGIDLFCWIQDDVFFYVTVVSFVLLVLLFNLIVFLVVLVQIRHMQANKPAATGHKASAMHDLRAVTGLTLLLGLTWLIGFFTWGAARVPMLYLFAILNSLQGFFIFVFHCLMKENVRKQWRIYLCCGRFRLSDYSDWSRSVTMGGTGRTKENHLVQCSVSVKSGNTSSRKVSDDSDKDSSSNGVLYYKRA